MNKMLLLPVILILVLGLVSAQELLSDISNTEIYCEDSDSGNNPFEKGNVTITNGTGSFQVSDTCLNSNILVERVCNSENPGPTGSNPTEINYDCSAYGYNCSGGFCAPNEDIEADNEEILGRETNSEEEADNSATETESSATEENVETIYIPTLVKDNINKESEATEETDNSATETESSATEENIKSETKPELDEPNSLNILLDLFTLLLNPRIFFADDPTLRRVSESAFPGERKPPKTYYGCKPVGSVRRYKTFQRFSWFGWKESCYKERCNRYAIIFNPFVDYDYYTEWTWEWVHDGPCTDESGIQDGSVSNPPTEESFEEVASNEPGCTLRYRSTIPPGTSRKKVAPGTYSCEENGETHRHYQCRNSSISGIAYPIYMWFLVPDRNGCTKFRGKCIYADLNLEQNKAHQPIEPCSYSGTGESNYNEETRETFPEIPPIGDEPKTESEKEYCYICFEKTSIGYLEPKKYRVFDEGEGVIKRGVETIILPESQIGNWCQIRFTGSNELHELRYKTKDFRLCSSENSEEDFYNNLRRVCGNIISVRTITREDLNNCPSLIKDFKEDF